MAKTTIWHIYTEDAEHTVTYSLNRISGRMTVTLDGDAYTLSGGPFALKAARREPFRIVSPDGEAEMALLVIDSKGQASLLFRSEEIPCEEQNSGVVVEIGFKK